jgi:putative transposase
MAQGKLITMSEEALFRYQVVSQVRARIIIGKPRARAMGEVLALDHRDIRGRRRPLSARTLYRWLAAFERSGPEGLEPEPPTRIAASTVLSPRLLDFLNLEKTSDAEASIPELLLRARLTGVIAQDEPIDRTSVWRALKRMGIKLTRLGRLKDKDMHRFAHPHRMRMVLADGKHFRAGVARAKRLALVVLDDSSRYGLDLEVGTTETAELFLEALYGTVGRHGLMQALFLDNGCGFIADDTYAVTANLGVALIHGTAGYPEGHGKIEKFNRTFKSGCLRGLDNSPEVDPDPGALRLRLSHWLHNVYNHTPHEGIGMKTPAERWNADPHPLNFPEDRAWLDDAFVVRVKRTVSKDNVIKHGGQIYEVPRGHARDKIVVTRHLRENHALSILHDGRQCRLEPVDLTANAYARRAQPVAQSGTTGAPAPQTAATLAFEADFKPVVDADGGYPKGDDDDE